MSERDVAVKADAIREALAEHESVLIAFSDGVGSSVVAALAHETLGDDTVACTAESETLPDAELGDTKCIAEETDIEHLTVKFSELDNPDFVISDDDRRYHRRMIRPDQMCEAARDHGIETVCDRTNASDPSGDYRPDLRIVKGLEVLSSLLAHDITKEEVRIVADNYDLSVVDRPSMVCLSSQILTGLEVAKERLLRIKRAETILRTRGFEQLHVRSHDGPTHIGVAPEELDRALDADFVRTARDHLEGVGFDHVTFDLYDCRTGNVNPKAKAETDADAGDDDLLMNDMFTQDYPMRK